MNQPQLALADRLAICQQVARLAHARLPISGEIARNIHGSRLRAHAQQVDNQLQSGQSLEQVLASDDSRDARILSACIRAGESSGRLDRALEAWTAVHLADSQATNSLRTAMFYPLLLIAVTACSLGFVIWKLIPEYAATYALFDRQMPVWLSMLSQLHDYLWWILGGLVFFAIAPLVIWAVRRRRFDALGLPLDRSRRLRLQGLAADLSSLLIAHETPLMQAVPLSVAATGVSAAQVQTSFAKIQKRAMIEPLGRESTLLLASSFAGVMNGKEASEHLATLSIHLRQQADQESQRQARWLPMLIALVVGLLTILTYVFLIYLPWLLLLKQIVTPTSLGQ